MIDAWIWAILLTIAALVITIMWNFTGESWMWYAVLAMWIFLLLRLVYHQLSLRYSLTSQRLIHEHGILWRRTDRIEAIDIDDVTFSQGPIERMLGVGTVRITSSDQSTPEFTLVGIEDARRVATLIDEVRRKERRKRGVHIESI
jgi:membrane protein YdbS with pleckstrin-like domain